jgi:hypothetical protein
MPGQLGLGFPPKPVGRLLLAQENEVVELAGMVVISGSPMETLVDADSRWTTRPSWLCVTPMIMGIPLCLMALTRQAESVGRINRYEGRGVGFVLVLTDN